MVERTISPKFTLGQVLATPGALEALEKVGQLPADFLQRHSRGDWGEALCDQDTQANEQALVDGSRIFSAYHLKDGTKIWVITEAADDSGQRAATTILLPSEY